MCKKLLIAAESRRLGRTPVVVRYEDIDSSSDEEEDEDEEMEIDAIKKRKNSVIENPVNKKAKN